MLSHNELEISLPETKTFFSQFLSVLITYATEGTNVFYMLIYVYVYNIYRTSGIFDERKF